LIKKNIGLTGLKTSAVVIQDDAIRFLKDSKEIFDIIMADPPYDLRNGNEIIESVMKFRRLNPGGALILESSPKDKISAFEEYPELSLYKQKKWGETLVTILSKNV
jgi:16S rRNA G966 N2-methylase RsmD